MKNLLLMLCLFISFSAIAQNEMASGKISNPKGEPVSFATVAVKGTRVRPRLGIQHKLLVRMLSTRFHR
jgi:hypothetical protein